MFICFFSSSFISFGVLGIQLEVEGFFLDKLTSLSLIGNLFFISYHHGLGFGSTTYQRLHFCVEGILVSYSLIP